MTDRRSACITRTTKETDIRLEFDIDGSGTVQLSSGVPFLEHMLELFARHGLFDLRVQAHGDIEIDAHHTVEDIAICLGKAISRALGDKKGIRRYADVFVPMDEALVQVVVDLSGRPHFAFRGNLGADRIGDFDTELVHEFFWKLALEGRFTLHAIIHDGRNTHHKIEALFKAFGRVLDEATTVDPRVKDVPSTKGML